uniref:WW domain-containing protein n=1 Tax=Alexandrium monilatum TaxID=311494 RepID=A0A7S4Q5Z6_9DINO|mmetsp:Transcript_187/g.637  ORF Transcript_187/g.637 Transcript_187/m.637 type:complete len:346 (+) Transcript_187:35-1072(+)
MSTALPLLVGGAVDIVGDWPDLQRPYCLDLQQLLDALGISPLAPASVMEVARRAHAMPYPPHWTEQLDQASGALYFYHELQDESSWHHPLCETFREVLALVGIFEAEQTSLDVMAPRIEESLAEAQERATKALAEWVGPIPAGDGTEGEYFYNRTTGQSEWEDPRERWKYDLHVRYDLLVGFLVAEEKRAAKRSAPQGLRTPDLTPTLTSLASSLSSVASALAVAVAEPGGDDSEGEGYWARPRPRRTPGSLPLPPRSTASHGGGRSQADRALFSMPPHQQRYTADVLQQQEYIPRTGSHPQEYIPRVGRSSSQGGGGGGAFPGLIQQQPPPPPPGAPPRAAPRP